MRELLNQIPIATRLIIATLLVALLAILALGTVINNENQSEIEDLLTQNLITSTEELARTIDSFIEQEINQIDNLASSRSAREFISVAPAERAALFTSTHDDFANFLGSDAAYLAVLLVDLEGHVLLSTDGNFLSTNFSNFDFFDVRAPSMSAPSLFPVTDEALYWLSAPIFGDPRLTDEVEPLGRMLVSVSAEKLWSRFETFTIGQFGYAMLIDADGKRLAHGRDRNLVFRTLLETDSSDLWLKINETDDNLFIAPAPNGAGRVYHSTTTLASRDWKIVGFLHGGEVATPAQRLTQNNLIAIAGMVSLLAIVIAVVVQWMLRSIPKLANATEQIALTGDLSQPIDIKASGEIGVLADRFETMRQRLFDTNRELADWANTLETRVAEQSGELAALSEVVSTAARTQSRDDLLDTALRQSLSVMNAEMGAIWVSDGQGMGMAVSHGLSPELENSTAYFSAGESLVGKVLVTGKPIVTDNVAEDPRLERVIVREEKLRAFAAVPLSIRGNNHGVLGVFRRNPEPFNDEQVTLAASIGQQIALTLDNLELVDRVRNQTLTVASLQERERIAADIHDSMAQTVGYLYLQMDYLVESLGDLSSNEVYSHLNQQSEVLNRLSTEIRQFILQLREPAPAAKTVSQTIQDALTALKPELTLDVKLAMNGGVEKRLSAESTTELARIVGEALRNASKHSGADSAEITYHNTSSHSKLTIQDNGNGFVVGQLPDDGREHFGLKIMQARAQRLGGWLEIDSKLNSGTTITVEWQDQPPDGNLVLQ